jgi:hypothetical protein
MEKSGNNISKIPIGLDPKLFILNSTTIYDSSRGNYEDLSPIITNKNRLKSSSLSYSNIYDGMILWSELSNNLGLVGECESLSNIAEKFLAAYHIMETASEDANEMCVKVARALPENIQKRIHLKIVNGCAYGIYNSIIQILHSMKDSTPDRFKLSSAISFLDSDKNINDTVLAHQIIEDTYQVLKVIIPELNMSHDTMLLGIVHNHQSNKKVANGRQAATSPLKFSSSPDLHCTTTTTVCGKCQFKFLKYQ